MVPCIIFLFSFIIIILILFVDRFEMTPLIYRAFDPTDRPLIFVDDVKLNALDFVLIDETIEIYHVVGKKYKD